MIQPGRSGSRAQGATSPAARRGWSLWPPVQGSIQRISGCWVTVAIRSTGMAAIQALPGMKAPRSSPALASAARWLSSGTP